MPPSVLHADSLLQSQPVAGESVPQDRGAESWLVLQVVALDQFRNVSRRHCPKGDIKPLIWGPCPDLFPVRAEGEAGVKLGVKMRISVHIRAGMIESGQSDQKQWSSPWGFQTSCTRIFWELVRNGGLGVGPSMVAALGLSCGIGIFHLHCGMRDL